MVKEKYEFSATVLTAWVQSLVIIMSFSVVSQIID